MMQASVGGLDTALEVNSRKSASVEPDKEGGRVSHGQTSVLSAHLAPGERTWRRRVWEGGGARGRVSRAGTQCVTGYGDRVPARRFPLASLSVLARSQRPSHGEESDHLSDLADESGRERETCPNGELQIFTRVTGL